MPLQVILRKWWHSACLNLAGSVALFYKDASTLSHEVLLEPSRLAAVLEICSSNVEEVESPVQCRASSGLSLVPLDLTAEMLLPAIPSPEQLGLRLRLR
jgi:hypothetical protein